MSDPTDLARRMWADDVASRALGMDLRELSAGHAVVAMTVRADPANAERIRAKYQRDS